MKTRFFEENSQWLKNNSGSTWPSQLSVKDTKMRLSTTSIFSWIKKIRHWRKSSRSPSNNSRIFRRKWSQSLLSRLSFLIELLWRITKLPLFSLNFLERLPKGKFQLLRPSCLKFKKNLPLKILISKIWGREEWEPKLRKNLMKPKLSFKLSARQTKCWKMTWEQSTGNIKLWKNKSPSKVSNSNK